MILIGVTSVYCSMRNRTNRSSRWRCGLCLLLGGCLQNNIVDKVMRSYYLWPKISGSSYHFGIIGKNDNELLLLLKTIRHTEWPNSVCGRIYLWSSGWVWMSWWWSTIRWRHLCKNLEVWQDNVEIFFLRRRRVNEKEEEKKRNSSTFVRVRIMIYNFKIVVKLVFHTWICWVPRNTTRRLWEKGEVLLVGGFFSSFWTWFNGLMIVMEVCQIILIIPVDLKVTLNMFTSSVQRLFWRPFC